MGKQILKNKLNNYLERIGWRILTTFILTLTAVFTVWVYAAFVEPLVGPNDAGWDQDFSQNILGANNANNDFDSSLVTASSTGSIIERLEYITNRMTTAGQWYSTECADSTTTTKTNCYVDDTAKYVNTNACSNASNTGYCYMNTATFSAMDADLVASKLLSGVTIFGITGTFEVTCYYAALPQTTDWNAGTYGCVGSDKRCYSGSCITCGGWMNANYCWYSGGDSVSCNTLCSTHSGVYNDTCDWVNDPEDCSTCKHWYVDYSCGGAVSYGPSMWGYYSDCRYHQDGYSDCSGGYATRYRQCACNS